MTGTVHIVLAMKPMSGNFVANARKHGVAGLNIDGARIATADEVSNHSRSELSAVSKGKFGDSKSQRTHQTDGQMLGRWPANVILGHLAGCRRTGVKKVKGNPHLGQKNPELVKQYGGGGFGGGRVGPGSGFAASDGTEAVEAWECQEGCPVAAMDGQSGDRPAGTWCRQTDTAHPFGGAKGIGYTEWKQVKDSGGASRYFKVVRGD